MPDYVLRTTVAIVASSVANPSVITTLTAHGLETGQTVEIEGHAGSTPDINDIYVVNVISPTTFSIPENVTVGGAGGTIVADRSQDIDGFAVRRTYKGSDQLVVNLLSADGSFRLKEGAEAEFDEDGNPNFGGFVMEATEGGVDDHGTVATVTNVTFAGFKEYASYTQFTGVIPAGTLKSVLLVLEAKLAPYGITLDVGQADGPSVAESTFDNENINNILDEYTGRTGWPWEVGPDKVLRAFEPGTVPAPFDITTANKNAIGDVKITRVRNNDYANVIIARGGEPGAYDVAYGETHFGDGATRQFFLNKPMHFFGPVILTVTIGGVPTDYVMDLPTYPTGTAEYTFDPTDHSIHQRSDQPILSGADSILVKQGYSALYPYNVIVKNLTAIADAGGIEKIKVIPVTDVYLREQLLEIANGVLAERSQSASWTARYRTEQPGALPGQTQTINATIRGVSATTWTITEVLSKSVGGKTTQHDITAVLGERPFPTWRDWWLKATSKSVGSSVALTGAGGGLADGPPYAIQVKNATTGGFKGDAGGLYNYTTKIETIEGANSKIDTRGTNDGAAHGVPNTAPAVSIVAKAGDQVLLSLAHLNPGLAKALTAIIYATSGDINFEFDDITLAFLGYGTNGEIQISAPKIKIQPGVPSAYRTQLLGINQIYGLQPRTQRVTSTSFTVDAGLTESNMTSAFIYAGSADGTVNLPALSAFSVFNNSNFPRLLFFKNDSAFNWVIDGNSTDTVGGNTTYTIPPGGSAAILGWNGTGADWKVFFQGGTATPAGSDTWVQFNDGGVLGADAGLAFLKALTQLRITSAAGTTTPLVVKADDGHVSINPVNAGYSDIWFGAERTAADDVVARDTHPAYLWAGSNFSAAGIEMLVGETPGSPAVYAKGVGFEIHDTGRFNVYQYGGLGTGAVPGCQVEIEQNTSGNGAAGCLVLYDKAGTPYYIWVEGGKLRIHTAPPTEDNTTVAHTAGTVVGAQS